MPFEIREKAISVAVDENNQSANQDTGFRVKKMGGHENYKISYHS
jgi:hypothetical protein